VKHKDVELVITPIPSGCSLGGSCWHISYKLHSILYAPQYSIETRYLCDPFPFELYKYPNILLTDTNFSDGLSIKKYAIEKKFRENLLELLALGRTVFIPCDTANIRVELIIKLEKLLDEFYSKESNSSSGYEVLVCGYTSEEIITNINSLVEFMGTPVSQQFYTYNEVPFGLKYIRYVKDMKEYRNYREKNKKFIILSSSESMDSGLSAQIFPDIYGDKRAFIFLVTRGNEAFNALIAQAKKGATINFQNVKRRADSVKAKDNEIVEVVDSRRDNPQIDGHIALKVTTEQGLTKKLFAKSLYPIFKIRDKKRTDEYGQVFRI
jgi:Cft2 family RNA processing exonuclease